MLSDLADRMAKGVINGVQLPREVDNALLESLISTRGL